MKNILIIGSNGNLGSEIKKHFNTKNYKLFTASRNPTHLDEIYLDGRQPLILPRSVNIDLIINAANMYFVKPNFEELELMYDAIIGVPQSLLLSKLACPIVYFSSYLQYLPEDMQPWSDYTRMKSKATDILKEYGERRQVTTLEITLADNYGGKRKNKFFDLALDTIINKKTLKATDGETVLNLTHVEDIVRSLEVYVDKNFDTFYQRHNLSFSIQANETFNLRKLVEYIETVSKKRVRVEWGAIPYRDKEVFEFYNRKPILPGFLQTQSLSTYISFFLSINYNKIN